MASNRKQKLVFGIFEDLDLIAKLLLRLRKFPSYQGKTFLLANERIQPDIERLIATPPMTRKSVLSPSEGTPMLMKYVIALPENQVVVGLNSLRPSEIKKLFYEFGAPAVHIENLSQAIGSLYSDQARSTVADAVSKVTGTRIYRSGGCGGVDEGSFETSPCIGSDGLTPGSWKDYLADPSSPETPDSALAGEDPPPYYPTPSYAFPDIDQQAFEGSSSEEHDPDLIVVRSSPPPPAVVSSSLLPPPPPPGTPGAPIERFIEGRFPLNISPEKTAYLEVRIAVQPAGGARTTQIKSGVLPEGRSAEILLLLHAPGFTILEGGRDRTITVPAAGNSDFAIWPLKSNTVGALPLSITAYYGGTCLGELNLESNVASAGTTHQSEARTSVAQFQQRTPGEITLEIRYDEQNSLYRCNFISDSLHSDDMKSRPFKITPESAIDSLIKQLNALAGGKARFDAEATREWLRGKGADLWIDFIPEELQRLFWNERTKISKITILSSGDPVPWELLYPTEPDRAADPATGFLGEAFNLTRWKFGRNSAVKLRPGSVCFVLPPGAPAKALAETEDIKAIVGGDSETVASLAELRKVFREKTFGVLHFACHNQFQLGQGSLSSLIKFEDGLLEPSTLTNYRNTFDRPFIFMNACRTDGKAPSYTRLTGWADKFLDTGAGAFVGSLWEVRDDSAAQFARSFYQEIKTRPLGEAVGAARKSIGDIGGDPTWLAYSVYGNATANIAE